MKHLAVLVVGGGTVALRKVKTLIDFGADVTVIGTFVCDDMQNLPVRVRERPYRRGDTDGYRFVYAATSNSQLNARIAREARTCGALVNVCDNPMLSDFISPAVFHHGQCIVAVSSNGKNVRASILLRQKLRKALNA